VATAAERNSGPGAAVPVFGISLGAALVLHGAVVFVLSRIDVDQLWNRNHDPLEFQVAEPPPPPPVSEPRPEPVEPPPVPPKVVTRRVDPLPPTARRPSPTPPPSNQVPPPNAAPSAPPVFGVTMSSVVSGEAAMAVPVGNTTMTKPRAVTSNEPPKPYAGSGPPQAFVPEPEINIAERAHVLHEVNSDDYYPPDARTLGIEGTVRAVLDIDERGRVVGLRVTRRAGHGFDEKAVEALRQFLFSPARTADGRPVRCHLAYDFRFTIGN
jgi:protein TonB